MIYNHKMEKFIIFTTVYTLLQILSYHSTSADSSYHSVPAVSIKLNEQNEKSSDDFCRHSFHSWMCQKTRKQKYSDDTSAPKNDKKSSGFFIREAVPVHISTAIVDNGFGEISSFPSYKSSISPVHIASSVVNKGSLKSPSYTSYNPSYDPIHLSTSVVDKGSKKSPSYSSYYPSNDPVHISTSVVNKGSPKSLSYSSYNPSNDPVHLSTSLVDKSLEKSLLSSPYNPNNDICNESVNSWRCQPKHKSILKGIFSSPATTKRPDLHKPSKVFSSLSTTSTKTALPPIKYDKCSHAFHSWMCPNESKKAPSKHNTKIASNINSVKLLPKLNETPKPYKMKDMCSHAFHSWLCQNRNEVKQNSKFETIPKSSSNFPVHQIPTTTQKPILLPATPKPILLPATHKSNLLSTKHFKKDEEQLPTNEKTYNKCHHAFHSWLCDLGPKKPAQQEIKSPPPVIKFTLPTKLNSNKVTNTVKKPVQQTLTSLPSKNPTLPFKSNSNKETNSVKYDKCSHAFHSWMCSKPKNKDIIKSPSPSLIFPNIKRPTIVLDPNNLKHKGKNSFSQFSQSDICNHPFHSWLCGKNTKKSGNGNDFSKENSLLTTKVNSQTSVPATSKVPKSQTKNACGILFNNQNCQSISGRTNKLSMFHSPVLFHFKKTINLGSEENSEKTPRHESQELKDRRPVPQLNTRNRFNFPDSRTQAKPKLAQPFFSATGIKLATSTQIRKNQKPLQQKNHCDHPFHSWNCNRANLKQRTIINIKEIPNISDLPLEGEKL